MDDDKVPTIEEEREIRDARGAAADSEATKPPRVRGFAALSPERRTEISSKGGRAAHAAGTAHQFNASEAKAAGMKGGAAPHVSRGRGGKKPA